jgi:hypothetical protein
MVMSSKLLTIAAAALALGACSHVDPKTGSVDRRFGEVTAWNKAVQVINPDGTRPAPGAAQPGGSGDVAAGAANRYRTNQVKQIEEVQTSNTSSGGSGPR